MQSWWRGPHCTQAGSLLAVEDMAGSWGGNSLPPFQVIFKDPVLIPSLSPGGVWETGSCVGGWQQHIADGMQVV